MFPAALAIVVNVFPLRERGKALALVLRHRRRADRHRADPGRLPDPVDVAGHLLGQHPGRPHRAGPDRRVEAQDPVPAGADRLPRRRPHRGRHRAEHLRPAAVGPVGLEQSRTWICIIGGLLIIARLRPGRAAHRRRRSLRSRIFRIRAFTVENLVLLIAMMAFIPVFFFASEYAQIALHKTASEAGIFLLVLLPRLRHRRPDRAAASSTAREPNGPSSLGCAIAAVGFGLWASKATTLSFGKQQIWVIVAGAGMGMMLGPANTDAVNRAGNLSYGEATGHHPDHPELRRQPRPGRARHDPAVQLPLAPDDASLQAKARPNAAAEANRITQTQQGSGSVTSIPHFVSLDFAHATQAVLYVMCGIMAFAGARRPVRPQSVADGSRTRRGRLTACRCPSRSPPRTRIGLDEPPDHDVRVPCAALFAHVDRDVHEPTVGPRAEHEGMTTFITRYETSGPGVRLAVKDLIDMEGEPTTAGCRAVADRAVPAAAGRGLPGRGPGGGGPDRRPHQPARAGPRRDRRQPVVRDAGEPARPDPRARRLVERLGGRGGHRRGRRGLRQRHRRLGPHPRRLLRHGRAEDDLGPHPARRRLAAVAQLRHRRPDGPRRWPGWSRAWSCSSRASPWPSRAEPT